LHLHFKSKQGVYVIIFDGCLPAIKTKEIISFSILKNYLPCIIVKENIIIISNIGIGISNISSPFKGL